MKSFHKLNLLKEAGEHDLSSAVSYHDITVAYKDHPVLWDIDLDIPSGKRIAIVGPNGAGKSTMLKVALGLLEPIAGHIKLFGVQRSQYKQEIGYVPQREEIDWDFPVTALDVASMGSYRRIGLFKRVTGKHKKEAYEALEKMEISKLASRPIGELSGGQQQRVFLARALVQKARLLFMDEPFTGIDASTEKAIANVLKELKNQGNTIVAVHHDLQTVDEYFDHVVLVNMRIIASGPVEKVFTKENIKSTYGGRLTILDEITNKFEKNVF